MAAEMMNDDDFQKELDILYKNAAADGMVVAHVKLAPPKVELTLNQKLLVIDYMMQGPGKGLFEDVPEFWDGVDDVDEAYPSLRDAVDDYVDGLRERLLAELTNS